MPQSHTTALRTNLGVHSQGPTSHGVCTRVRFSAALSSMTSSMLWCCWRCVAGTRSVISPSTICCTAVAFSSPHAMSTMRSARMMVPIPMVIAILGVFSKPKNCCDCTLRELCESSTRRVCDLAYEPCSLKPTWPFSPKPIIMRSILRIDLSRFAQYSETSLSGIVPSGICTFSGCMSICLRNSSWIRKLRLCCSVRRMG